jgi:hypothetical protein
MSGIYAALRVAQKVFEGLSKLNSLRFDISEQ